MTVLDHPLISSRYFFPRADQSPSPRWVDAPGGRLACHAHVVDDDAPWVLHFHGNGEVAADYVDLGPVFARMGCSTLFAEYRGYGGSDGAPALAGMLDDVAALLEATGAQPSRVVAFGRSVGSIYAIECAARFGDLAGLVLESGIADPLQRVLLRVTPAELGVDDEELAREATARLDHAKKLGSYLGPLLVLHAAGDDLVTVDHAEANHANAGGDDKELVVFARGDHNSIFFANQAAYLDKVRAFIAKAFG